MVLHTFNVIHKLVRPSPCVILLLLHKQQPEIQRRTLELDVYVVVLQQLGS
jgi:hypothetical protein